MFVRSIAMALSFILATDMSRAAELEVPAPAAGSAYPAIYENDFALVHDRRTVRLPASTADLAFTGVSERLQPAKALLEVLNGESLAISEQTFSFDVITPERLMEQAVGQDVGVVIVNPATGKETIERAKVLGVANGLVIEMNGKIHTGVPGRIVIDQMPEGLRSSPTPLMAANGVPKRDTVVELSYLTCGLSWRTDYVAQYDPDADRMDLKAWATIINTTGMDLKDANVKLVAGAVNRIAPQPTPRVMQAMEMQMDAVSAPMANGVGAESLVAYHMYSLHAATTLNDRESKQLALLEGRGIAVKRDFIARSQPHFFTTSLRGQTQESRADVQLTVTKNTAAKLGVPLPVGTVRIYTMDVDGALQFLGEGNIDHTAEDGEVNVKLGSDFDVPVLREQTNCMRASDNITLTNWRVTVRNAKPHVVTVRVVEQLPGPWEITRKTVPHKKLNASEVEWALQAPAKGRAVVEYNIRTRF